MRLVSNRRIFERPATLAVAWDQVEAWLGQPPVWIPQPTEAHREILGRLVADAGGRGSLVPDLHLAALAIEHGPPLQHRRRLRAHPRAALGEPAPRLARYPVRSRRGPQAAPATRTASARSSFFS